MCDYYLDELNRLRYGKVVDAVATEGYNGIYYGLIVQAIDGSKWVLEFLRDEEGNGPGSFEIREAE